MPKTYLCAVSSKFPENYDIGVIHRVWGVEEKYRKKMAWLHHSDQILFTVAGSFRSFHRVESDPFFDDTLLWPEKNGSRFPHRVRMSPALFVGEVPVKDLAPKISFMKDKKNWGGAIQGPNGVLNPKLTPADVDLILQRLTPRVETGTRPERRRPVAPRPFTFTLTVDAFTDEVKEALRQLGLEATRVRAREDGRGLLLHLARPGTHQQVVAGVFVDPPKTDDVLAVLREMIAVRGQLPDAATVDGLLLSLVDDPELADLVNETKSVRMVRYDLGVRLRDA